MMTGTAASTFLGTLPLFAGMTPEELDVALARVRARAVASGTEIISQGEPGDAVYVITQGSMKVCRRQAEGGEVILAVLGSGEVVGEMSVADGLDHSCSVVAIEDSTILRLDAESFRRMLAVLPSVRSGLVELLCKRLRLADGRLETLASLDVEGRVASVLLSLAREHGQPKPGGGMRIAIPLTQGDVAAMTGASRVRVNQVLSKFKRYGWITLDGGRRTSVRDVAALEARCR
jgi:CRP-like cAMP-binding protein